MTLAEANVISALGTPNGMAGAASLAALVRETVSAGVERRVLLLKPSGLAPARRKSPHMALLREAWGGLRRTSRTRLFDLPRGTMVAIESPPGHHLAETHGVLAGMLEPGEVDGTLALLRLPDQAAAVLAAIEDSLGLAAAVRAASPGVGRAPDAEEIAATERAIASADISAFVRRQRVCRLTSGGGAPDPLWEDRRPVLADVRDALLPGRDLAPVPGLARRLRRALERRLLAGLSHAEELRAVGALSMPLLIDSVTSAEFLRLDSMWPAALRGRLTIAFGAEDVAADPAGFVFARDFLAARGHRAMLEATGPAAVHALPAARAGVAAVRLRWSEALPPLGSPESEALRAAFPAERDAVVLSGVDRPAAIAWGWEMGITLFQGRLVESRRPMA